MGVLDKLTIAVTGTHPHDTKQIRSWIEKNGGKFSAGIKKNVTHLVASKETYKACNDAVRQAIDLGIDVVSYDWFDDSLQARRKLSTRKYKWQVLTKDKRTRKELKRLGKIADGKKFRDGCARIKELTGSGTSKSTSVGPNPRKSKSFFFASTSTVVPPTPFVSAKEDLLRRRAEREVAVADGKEASGDDGVNETEDHSRTPVTSFPSPSTPSSTSLKKPKSQSSSPTDSSPIVEAPAKLTHWKDSYHYYQDQTGFDYKIVLVRSDFTSASFAQYHIGLLESHAKPHTYWTIAQYKPAAATKSSLPPPVQAADNHQQTPNHTQHPYPEASRLISLITPPLPTHSAPYKTSLCPPTSTFPVAFTAFRHAFRDLTLLSWEERFDCQKKVQKARAVLLNTEPFVYGRPKQGMPTGLFPQEKGMLVGDVRGVEVRGDVEDGYVRGCSGLPGMWCRLGRNGAVGSAVCADAEDAKGARERDKRRRGFQGE